MITGTLIGGPEAVARFKSFPDRLRAEMKIGVGRAALRVLTASKQKLSDDVLHVRTGRLRRSINVKDLSSGENVQASVGTNVVYAHIHEYGFAGTVSVRAHLRAMPGTKGFADKKDRGKFGFETEVKAHTMKMNMPARSFLRSALADMEEQTRAEIEAAMQRAIG